MRHYVNTTNVVLCPWETRCCQYSKPPRMAQRNGTIIWCVGWDKGRVMITWPCVFHYTVHNLVAAKERKEKRTAPLSLLQPFLYGHVQPPSCNHKSQAATGVIICPHNLKGQGKNLGTSKLKGPWRRNINQNFPRMIQCLTGTQNISVLTEQGFGKAASLEKNWRKCGTKAATLLHSLVTAEGSKNNCKMH